MDHSGNAAAHRRTRADHAQETAEDYVEAIADLVASKGSCRIVDLASRFGVSHVTTIRVVKRLEKENLLTTTPYGPVELTTKGHRLAKACRDRHKMVYQFLLKLGVGEHTAKVDAEGIEHHLSSQTLAAIRNFVETP